MGEDVFAYPIVRYNYYVAPYFHIDDKSLFALNIDLLNRSADQNV